MRFFITSATIIAICTCSAAYAQNAQKACDAECVQRLQQSISDLQQRVSALEQEGDTTGTVSGATAPDIYWETYVPNPATLTPYISALNCQRHDQTVTVPSEGGGTSQISVRRC
jgi:hypothetical protein